MASNNGGQDSPMVDEMFDGGHMDMAEPEDAVSGNNPNSALLSELTNSDRTVHADFYNNFGDLFDDKNLD